MQCCCGCALKCMYASDQDWQVEGSGKQATQMMFGRCNLTVAPVRSMKSLVHRLWHKYGSIRLQSLNISV